MSTCSRRRPKYKYEPDNEHNILKEVKVCFPYIYRRAAVRTTGCLGDRFEPMSLLVESRADTDTRLYHGSQSSPRSPGRSQCLLGFHSDRLKDTDRDTDDSDTRTFLRNVAVKILFVNILIH